MWNNVKNAINGYFAQNPINFMDLGINSNTRWQILITVIRLDIKTYSKLFDCILAFHISGLDNPRDRFIVKFYSLRLYLFRKFGIRALFVLFKVT